VARRGRPGGDAFLLWWWFGAALATPTAPSMATTVTMLPMMTFCDTMYYLPDWTHCYANARINESGRR
jgi:hypothetical protein